ncbi:protein yippee-like [Anopheles ziemanni]|uniref:protein yippee-like n=1 Tax=Anopheles coustani TaxID=139045 RepID=UPI0026596355|nr:protein yippee-like [Anopheles coustani]XP_058175887.1 protein yippee-like [Anopheles ziemanni]
MGKVFMDHIGGRKLYNCAACGTNLTNRRNLLLIFVDTSYGAGASGRFYMFQRVVNITYSQVMERFTPSGRHMVRDVMCKNCKVKLGWMHEFTDVKTQMYKEGRVVIEYANITESEGFPET